MEQNEKAQKMEEFKALVRESHKQVLDVMKDEAEYARITRETGQRVSEFGTLLVMKYGFPLLEVDKTMINTIKDMHPENEEVQKQLGEFADKVEKRMPFVVNIERK